MSGQAVSKRKGFKGEGHTWRDAISLEPSLLYDFLVLGTSDLTWALHICSLPAILSQALPPPPPPFVHSLNF